MQSQRRGASGTMLVLACLSVLPAPVSGQARPAPGPLLEARIDLTAGDVSSATLAAGSHLRAGTYFRLALLAALGQARRGDETGNAARLELQGRFHLDPYREARLGLYGVGGIAAARDDFRGWQGRLVLGAGVELPARGRAAIAIEGAFAGGVRLSVIARRLPEDRR